LNQGCNILQGKNAGDTHLATALVVPQRLLGARGEEAQVVFKKEVHFSYFYLHVKRQRLGVGER